MSGRRRRARACVLLLPRPKQSVVVVVAVGDPALDQLSVPAVTVRNMVDDPKSE